MGVRRPPARRLANLAAARAVRALEVLVFHPMSPPGVAATMGLHERTARRLLYALEDEGYLQRGHGTGRQAYVFSVTPRLLALAGQLAARLPLVTRGERVVGQLRERTGLAAYVAIPSYGDVIVVARAGDEAPALWSLLPATASAGGSVLLAYRQSWRDDQRRDDESPTRLDLEARAAAVRDHGYAIDHDQHHAISLAVPVPTVPTPLAALVLTGPATAVSDDQRERLLTVLTDEAARLADSHHRRRHSPSPRETSTLPVTANDLHAGCIRLPNAAKPMLPPGRTETTINLRGTYARHTAR